MESSQYVDLLSQLNKQLIELYHNDGQKFSCIAKVLDSFNSAIRDEGIQFEYILENQRGMQFFGIPLFSHKSLLPLVDPPTYQTIDEKPLHLSENTMNNYPLPDLAWRWDWDTWYVLMYNDVDDQGWIYSNIIFNRHLSDSRWKGKYYFGNFIRRRIWIRMRVRSFEPPAEELKNELRT